MLGNMLELDSIVRNSSPFKTRLERMPKNIPRKLTEDGMLGSPPRIVKTQKKKKKKNCTYGTVIFIIFSITFGL